jgi:hypothetical protein
MKKKSSVFLQRSVTMSSYQTNARHNQPHPGQFDYGRLQLPTAGLSFSLVTASSGGNPNSVNGVGVVNGSAKTTKSYNMAAASGQRRTKNIQVTAGSGANTTQQVRLYFFFFCWASAIILRGFSARAFLNGGATCRRPAA